MGKIGEYVQDKWWLYTEGETWYAFDIEPADDVNIVVLSTYTMETYPCVFWQLDLIEVLYYLDGGLNEKLFTFTKFTDGQFLWRYSEPDELPWYTHLRNKT